MAFFDSDIVQDEAKRLFGDYQQLIAAGHHGAALVQQRLAAPWNGPDQRQLAGEVHAGSSGHLAEPWAWRESALPPATGILQNLR